MKLLKSTVCKHKNSWDGTAYTHHTTHENEVVYDGGNLYVPRAEVDNAVNQIVPSAGYFIHATCKANKSKTGFVYFERVNIVFEEPKMPEGGKCYFIWYPLRLEKEMILP
jgi:hypothetical protein